MKVKDIMVTSVITATTETTIQEALNLMEVNKIRHLPILDKTAQIAGIISDRDLRDACPSIFDDNNITIYERPLLDIMTKNVLTAFSYDFIEEAANMMTENQISCLPVEDDGKLIGIITEKDLLNTFVKLTGVDVPTSRLELEVANKSGMLSEVASVIKEHNINIQSALVYPAETLTKKILLFRLQTMDIRILVHSLRIKGYTILWPTDLEMK
ncbi:CBS and ACT domain-containing protein [Evansella cellulosilytica]|uniref:CBS domain containing membrane protein n=1 Tax=Evansella cellulosilytica (strain ATCC 21833 / DSM 2522 / FERM P-1141 / JCM 9156 / N-4) TaxID=649639 RepID=E6U164_EVAC2|nr:CBS and ACT domain-containing protein [Evansella cellulosilytica]ADU31510.1 CBS domain containing membrane protein [Evansella cellulosilytica DSM 2522]